MSPTEFLAHPSTRQQPLATFRSGRRGRSRRRTHGLTSVRETRSEGMSFLTPGGHRPLLRDTQTPVRDATSTVHPDLDCVSRDASVRPKSLACSCFIYSAAHSLWRALEINTPHECMHRTIKPLVPWIPCPRWFRFVLRPFRTCTHTLGTLAVQAAHFCLRISEPISVTHWT